MSATTLKGRAKPKPVYAWAAVGPTGKVLRWKGRYAIYTHQADAADDCPRYGQVRRVRISVCAIRDGANEK